MKKISAAIDSFTDVACFVFICVAFIITMFHIVGRYLLREPIFFSEELARYCFIWSCMLGASVVNRKDEHTNVTFFTNSLPPRPRAWFYIFREIVILILLSALVYFGVDLSIKMRTVYSAAMEISWSFIYMALPVGSVLVGLTTIRLIAAKLRELKTL